jgi:hypothetical protein
LSQSAWFQVSWSVFTLHTHKLRANLWPQREGQFQLYPLSWFTWCLPIHTPSSSKAYQRCFHSTSLLVFNFSSPRIHTLNSSGSWTEYSWSRECCHLSNATTRIGGTEPMHVHTSMAHGLYPERTCTKVAMYEIHCLLLSSVVLTERQHWVDRIDNGQRGLVSPRNLPPFAC